MMDFLLFNPQPDSIEMIGLGGESLVKFCEMGNSIAFADHFCVE